MTNPLEIKNPIRMYGPNDPYFWEVDNLPLEDLLENTARLQLQIDELPNFGIYATVGGLESQFVKIPDFNNRRLEDLDEDVNFSLRTPQQNDIFLFNNNFWRAEDTWDHRHIFPKTIGDLHDVDDALNTPANIAEGSVLKWQNGEWQAGEDIEYPYMDDILDVTIADPADGDILFRAGTEWVNGRPDTLPPFANYGDPADGDVLYFDGENSAYVAGSLKELPNQTSMFRGDGVELLGGSESVDFGSTTFNNSVPWRNKFYAVPDNDSLNTIEVPNGIHPDGSEYDIKSFYGTLAQARWAYVYGVTQTWRGSDSLTSMKAGVDLAFLNDSLGNGCAYYHANTYAIHDGNISARPKQVKTFTAWVPIQWNDTNAGFSAGTPTLSIAMFKDVSATNYWYRNRALCHIRVLGVRN